MLKISEFVIACMFLFVIVVEASGADEAVTAGGLRLAIAGNTVEATRINGGSHFKLYFHPSGKLAQLDDTGIASSGQWSIRADSELCLNTGVEVCRQAKRHGENGFDLLNNRGVAEITIEKVIIGNPGKLKPWGPQLP